MAMSLTPINLKEIEITDPKLIQKYMNQFEKFFIPADEHDTFDTGLLESEILHKSSEIVGQHHPIEVAICENDPNPDSSPYHIHLRPIDGRHRWKDARKHGVRWFCKFYNIKDYNQYMTLRGHFDAKKEITQNERTVYFTNLGKYYENVLHVPPPQICAAIVKDYSPPFHQATIRRYIPQQYKNPDKQKACMSSVKIRHPMPIREIQAKNPQQIRNDYANRDYRINVLEKENEFLKSEKGQVILNEPAFILEELVGNNWNFLHVCMSEKDARGELESLDAGKYRVRKIIHHYEYIYKNTTDKEILKKMKTRETTRKHRKNKQ